MKAAISLTVLLFLAAGMSIQAQSRTVTNADLEKFKQKRLAAERDYEENYEKMGFPSPEELERQLEQSRLAQQQLAARLATERIEREWMQIERDYLAIEQARLALERDAMDAAAAGPYYDGYFNSGYPGYYYPGGLILGRRHRRSTYANVGNGIPLVNYFGNRGSRSPVIGMGRR